MPVASVLHLYHLKHQSKTSCISALKELLKKNKKIFLSITTLHFNTHGFRIENRVEGAWESVLQKKFLLSLKALDILVCLSYCFICFNTDFILQSVHWNNLLKIHHPQFACLEYKSYL